MNYSVCDNAGFGFYSEVFLAGEEFFERDYFVDGLSTFFYYWTGFGLIFFEEDLAPVDFVVILDLVNGAEAGAWVSFFGLTAGSAAGTTAGDYSMSESTATAA